MYNVYVQLNASEPFRFKIALKTKFCNNLQTKNLESVVGVAMKGMYVDCGSILVETIALWKNSRKFRWIFFHVRNTFQDMWTLQVKVLILS